MSRSIISLDREEGGRYGYLEAALLHQLRLQIKVNKMEGRHLHNGRTWSVATYADIASTLRVSVGQARRAVKNLAEADVLIIGKFKQKMCDQSHWYAVRAASEPSVTVGGPQ